MRRQYLFTIIAVLVLSSLLLFTHQFYTPLTQHLSTFTSHSSPKEIDDSSQQASPNVSPPIHPPADERRAYATFLATRLQDADTEDAYFTAVRVLNYQLQHSPDTRTRQAIPFVVLVAPFVSAKKRDTLTAEGAIVVPVELLEPDGADWLRPGETRFVDQFTKLRLFQQTQYDRILYLDADMLLLRSLDDIWDEPVARVVYPTLTNAPAARSEAVTALNALLPDNYTLVGVSDTGGAQHPFPPPSRPR
jgi:inositol 3-alpha-galactosyltransferase